jgi:hypothetical protein
MQFRTNLAAIVLAAAGGLVPAQAFAQIPTAAVGVYQLTEVDAAPLPALVDVEGDCREELVSASLTLHANGQWTLASIDRETCDGQMDENRETEDGWFTVEGSTITFLDEDGDLPRDRTPTPGHVRGKLDIEHLGTGTLAGDVLTIRLEEGAIAVFRR